MAEQCFTCSAMAHGISVAKLHRQSLRLLTFGSSCERKGGFSALLLCFHTLSLLQAPFKVLSKGSFESSPLSTPESPFKAPLKAPLKPLFVKRRWVHRAS